MKIPDDVRGDAPMRLAIHHDRGGLRHGLSLVPALICFATSSMSGAPGARAEEDEGPPSSEPGREIPSKCAKCAVENDKDAKFCKGCGASMATKPMEDDDDEPPSSEEPGSSRREGAHPPPPKRVAAIGPDAAYAELAGVPSASSVPVIKGALAGLTNLARHVMGAFEVADPERATAALDDVIQLAARVPQLETRLKEQEDRAKLELGLKIVGLKIDGYPRSDVIRDVVNDAGKRLGVKLTREYRRMSFAEMDEKYQRLAARAPKRRTTPFEPDPERAREAAGAGQLTKAEEVAVDRMLRDPSNTFTREQIVHSVISNRAAMGGAS